MNGPRASNPTTAAAAAPTKKGSDSAAAAGQSSSGGKSQYQQDTERDNPEPAAASTKGSVTLSNCQFLTAPDKLILNEEFEMSVSVKAPADDKNRLATFDLFCTRTRNGKEERTRMWARQNGKIAKEEGESVEVQAKGSLVTPSDYVTGESVKFQLEANHDQASAPEPSKLVEVSLKTQACWVGGDDLFFRTDGELPLLKEDGSLIQVLATVIDRVAKPPQKTPETVICFGYASSAGDAGPNRKLSLRRAQVVKAILERDTGAWDGLAKANFETRDIQQFLSDLHKACGWECDPVMVDGKVHPETTTAIESFQRECNGRYKLGLKEDGVCGPKTWGAVLRVIHGQVQSALGQDPSKEPSWAKPKWGHGGKGVYANGEDFASGGDKPEERSVQITFFSQGSEPKLVDKIDAPATISDNPVHDPKKTAKTKVPRGGGASPAPTQASPTSVAGPIRFVRSQHRPGVGADMSYSDYSAEGDPARNLRSYRGINAMCWQDGLPLGLLSWSDANLFRYFKLSCDVLFAKGRLLTNINSMVDRMHASTGGNYSNAILTEAVREHASYAAFVQRLGQSFETEITKAKGVLQKVGEVPFNHDNRPRFNTKEDKFWGLTIAINDTWAYDVDVANYEPNPDGSYSAVLNVTIYDHFGLDEPDLDISLFDNFKPYGMVGLFRAWFVLQHIRGFRPFVTTVAISHPVSGRFQ